MLQSLRSIRALPRGVALALLSLALLARLAVPAGWMPVSDAQGIRVTICTGMGALDASPDAMAMPGMSGHHMPDHHKQDSADHVCPFAGAALALAEPVLPTLALPAPVAQGSSRLLHVAVAIGCGLAAPPPPSTGPPDLV